MRAKAGAAAPKRGKTGKGKAKTGTKKPAIGAGRGPACGKIRPKRPSGR